MDNQYGLGEVSQRPGDVARDVANRAAEEAGRVGRTVTNAIGNAAGQVRENVQNAVGYLRDNDMKTISSDFTGYVKSHPTQAIVAAAILGFAAGRLMRRG